MLKMRLAFSPSFFPFFPRECDAVGGGHNILLLLLLLENATSFLRKHLCRSGLSLPALPEIDLQCACFPPRVNNGKIMSSMYSFLLFLLQLLSLAASSDSSVHRLVKFAPGYSVHNAPLNDTHPGKPLLVQVR